MSMKNSKPNCEPPRVFRRLPLLSLKSKMELKGSYGKDEIS
jgi:hypothetical protein